ncbi:hypothetical protein EV424DRAFT_1402948 [Suillus variegatus]|nr:hypothetical protein EV424DRAFT_1402948 [Suillus variegatus]
MAASPDGELLALEIDGDIDHPTHFYDMKGHEFTTSNMKCTYPFAFSLDGKFFAASSVPSDSKDGSCKPIIRSVEEIRGRSPLDLSATIIPKDKGKQRSLGLNPAFFESTATFWQCKSSVHQQASTGRERRVSPLSKFGNGFVILGLPRQGKLNRCPRDLPIANGAFHNLANIWTRIRHPSSHRVASTERVVDVPLAQAKRDVVSRPLRTATAQSSSSTRENARSQTMQAGRPEHTQGHIDVEERASIDQGWSMRSVITQSVKAHGCWNIFWKLVVLQR